jgi:hypothetical protein
MNELIKMTKVFIIESPAFIDILDNRNEGDALCKTLDLAKIENEMFHVSDMETLQLAFVRIAQSVSKIKEVLGGIYIHFSMHGSNEGLQLSDKSFLPWRDFYELIKDFNDNLGYIENPNRIKIAPIFLVFSVCDGFNAKAVKNFGDESPFTALIGPTRPIEWADSLIAFSIFYHNIVLKKLGIKVALKNMNEFIGDETVFQSDLAKGMILR